MVDYISETTVSQIVRGYVEENLVYRRPFEQISIADDPTDSYRVGVTTDNMGAIQRVERGAEIPFDEEGIEQLEGTVEKWALATPIPWEDQNDSRFDVVQRNVEKQGRRMMELWNREAFQCLSNNLHPQSPYDKGGSKSGQLDFEDIIQARQVLLEDGYTPETLYVSPEAETDLLLGDTGYQRMTDYGDDIIIGGEVGEVAGLSVVRDDSGLLSGNNALLVDDSDYGFEVVKRDVSTNSWTEDSRESDVYSISSRFDHLSYDPEAAIKVQG